MGWETDDSTGLLGHFIGTIQDSVWTTDSKRQDPNKPFLSWDVSVDDILQENFEGTPPESMTVTVSIGNGWTEDEDGLTVEHTDGVESFKGSTAYGKIISLVSGKATTYPNAVVKDGDGDLDVDLTDVAKYMQANGYDDPRNSSIWKGLTFEFRGVGFRYRGDKDTPDSDLYQNVLPVRLVGEGEVVSKPAAAPAAERAPVDTVGVWVGAGADQETATTLNDLANSCKNHTEFRKQALLLDAVKNDVDGNIKEAVMNADNFPS